jgi:hypothetical protein
MSLGDSLWYGLGRSAERLSSTLSRATQSVREAGPDRGPDGNGQGTGPTPLSHSTEAMLLAGLSAALLSGVRRWTASRRPGLGSLARGALAGAGAVACVHAFAVLRRHGSDEDNDHETRPVDVLDELLSGAGRGIIYAAILDPLLPGPPLLRGSLAGTAEYLSAPLGGIFSNLEKLSPIRRVPFISVLLETGEPSDDDSFFSFLAYGLILGALYGDTGRGGRGP